VTAFLTSHASVLVLQPLWARVTRFSAARVRVMGGGGAWQSVRNWRPPQASPFMGWRGSRFGRVCSFRGAASLSHGGAVFVAWRGNAVGRLWRVAARVAVLEMVTRADKGILYERRNNSVSSIVGALLCKPKKSH
jgi:hypothetical protein